MANLVGQTVVCKLNTVKPNPWNPNKMTDRLRESLKHGLETDGWIVSQALLIWGEDEAGKKQNVIIDGEHRWRMAVELGMPEGPMVFMNGLSEAQAKALTVKMNQKRGNWDDAGLAALLKDIEFEIDASDLGMELGFEDEDVMKYLAVDEPEEVEVGAANEGHKAEPSQTLDARVQQDGGGEGEADEGRMEDNHVRLVQLFFNKEQHDAFKEMVADLAKKYSTGNVTETVYAALRDVSK